jgi:hypothetical protein
VRRNRSKLSEGKLSKSGSLVKRGNSHILITFTSEQELIS